MEPRGDKLTGTWLARARCEQVFCRLFPHKNGYMRALSYRLTAAKLPLNGVEHPA